MFARIRSQFGTAGLVIAVVALVASLAGVAVAASGLTGKQKKEVKAIAKSFQGTGPEGKQGPAGPTGATGPVGLAGGAGQAGAPGVNGKSVQVGTTDSSECKGLGGATVQVEGQPPKIAVCNGETGFTETLPGGKTETGSWVVGTAQPGATFDSFVYAAISFPIPLSDPLDGSHVHYVKNAETAPAGCTGGTVSVPAADPGHLCVYQGSPNDEENAKFQVLKKTDQADAAGATETGARIGVSLMPEFSIYGTWAVTAEEE